jgi:hypothetical protein
MAKVSYMTWIFGFSVLLQNKSNRHQCRGKVLKQKIYREKTLLQKYNTIFSEFFCLRDFRAVSIKKSHVTNDLGHGR